MITWPKNSDGTLFTNKIRLDKTSILDYLDEPPALPLRHTVANIVKKHNCKTVVDVGCGVGRMSKYLTVDKYMGFDDNLHLIRKGKRQNPNLDLRPYSWKELEKIKVDFEVDCLLLLGVLSYAMPEFPEVYEKNGYHIDVFNQLKNLYNPQLIIIQEILKSQTHIVETNELKVLPLEYYRTMNPIEYELDLPIWCGHRIILEILM